MIVAMCASSFWLWFFNSHTIFSAHSDSISARSGSITGFVTIQRMIDMWQRFAIGIALMLLASASLSAAQGGGTNESGTSVSELIDGDDFRVYVSRYVQGETAWSQGMRTFG